MYNYHEVTEGLINDAVVNAEDIYHYDNSPFRDVFDTYFQFCQENLSETFKSLINQPAQLFYQEDNRVNAWASSRNERSIISIYKGTIVTLRSVFHQNYHSDQEVHKEYEFIGNAQESPVPYLMYQLAGIFIFYHELAHLIQKSDREGLVIEELYITEAGNCYSRERHLLEMDADIFAIQRVYEHTNMFWEKLSPNYRTAESYQKILAMATTSVFIFFLYLQGPHTPLYLEQHSHPHSIIRISYVVDNIVKIANSNAPVEIDAKQVLRDVFLFTKSLSTPILGQGTLENYGQAIVDYQAAIEDYINSLIEDSKRMGCLTQNQNLQG